MEKVLIDEFIVPEKSKAAFLEGARKVQSFIRTLPGFVEGFIYEEKDGESQHNFLTTAVSESEETFANAKMDVAVEFKKRGYDPQETAKRLKIVRLRSTYERSPLFIREARGMILLVDSWSIGLAVTHPAWQAVSPRCFGLLPKRQKRSPMR